MLQFDTLSTFSPLSATLPLSLSARLSLVKSALSARAAVAINARHSRATMKTSLDNDTRGSVQPPPSTYTLFNLLFPPLRLCLFGNRFCVVAGASVPKQLAREQQNDLDKRYDAYKKTSLPMNVAQQTNNIIIIVVSENILCAAWSH